MSSWGKSRRNFILAVIFALVLIPISIFIISIYYEPPTCFDGKQNGDENGLDCGGSCDLLCEHQTIAPLVLWQRYFEVVPGVYNVLAYVENQNVDAKAENVEYVFELMDENNVILEERMGSVDLSPREIIPILETNLSTGKLKPTRVKFNFTEKPIWYKEDVAYKPLVVKDERIYEFNGYPRISAEILNTSVKTVNDVSVIVIVYDSEDNAISVSSTYIKAINKNETESIVFTWPKNFPVTPNRFEIIPLYEASL